MFSGHISNFGCCGKVIVVAMECRECIGIMYGVRFQNQEQCRDEAVGAYNFMITL
jgi:hypothetical protein